MVAAQRTLRSLGPLVSPVVMSRSLPGPCNVLLAPGDGPAGLDPTVVNGREPSGEE